MRTEVAALIAVVIWLTADSPCHAQAARAPRDTSGSRMPVNPYAEAALGSWSSDADSTGSLVISLLRPPDLILISARKRFVCTGMVEGQEFVGITRSPARGGFGSGGAHFGILRIPDLAVRPLTALFQDDLAGGAGRQEVWKPQRAFGTEDNPTKPGAGASDSLPKLGDYVYVEELPEAIKSVMPDYAQCAGLRAVEGTVVVQALVGKDGLVKKTAVVRSVPELDECAVAAVKQWRFKPAMTKGAPVAVWVAIPVKFALR